MIFLVTFGLKKSFCYNKELNNDVFEVISDHYGAMHNDFVKIKMLNEYEDKKCVEKMFHSRFLFLLWFLFFEIATSFVGLVKVHMKEESNLP